MKKILYIGNNLKTSNPTTLVQLSVLLRETGFEVTIYSSKKNKILRFINMCLGVLKNRGSDYILIDTYSTFNFYFAMIVSQLARVLSIKYIPILHGGNLPMRLRRSPILSKLIFNNAHINVTPSNYLQTEFKKKGFNTFYIPNAINIKKYKFKKRTTIQPKLLWVRAFNKVYNPEMAIEVLSLLKEKYPLARLCMIGPDKDGSLEEVRDLAIQKGVIDSVEFTGMLSKEVWIAKAEKFDVFINTTTIDNIPVSVIEAMALGLPIVSTNVGGLPYLITDAVNGALVNNNDAVEMTEKIIFFLNNEPQVAEITKNARRLVEEFDTAFVTQQWINLLK